ELVDHVTALAGGRQASEGEVVRVPGRAASDAERGVSHGGGDQPRVGAAGVLELAEGVAAIAADGVAVVADLAVANDPVTAEVGAADAGRIAGGAALDLAGRAAAVEVGHVAVIALLRRADHAVAAGAALCDDAQ